MPNPRRNSRLTKCSICGQPAVAGGRLCAPCRSALKRARDTTVSEGILPVRRGRKRPMPAMAAAPAEAVVEPALLAAPRGPRLSWAIAAALIAASGIGWFIYSHSDAGAAASRYDALSQSSSAEAPIALPSDAPVTQVPVQAAFTAVDHPPAPGAREPLDPRRMPSSIAVPRTAPKEPPAAPPQALPPVIAAPEPPPAPAPVVVAQAPAPKAVPDRWQRLSDQLAACPADPFKRAVCQESLRIEYCEGFWGRVPPCPAKAERDYGN
jgi:hypothetical protein